MVDVLLYRDLVNPFFPVAPEEESESEAEDRRESVRSHLPTTASIYCS